jgi:hypothetical protein
MFTTTSVRAVVLVAQCRADVSHILYLILFIYFYFYCAAFYWWLTVDRAPQANPKFTCFTSTKVQNLTQRKRRGSL